MDFEQFKEMTKEGITCFLNEENKDAEIKFEKVRKLGTNYTGITISREGMLVSPTLNMEEFYGCYLNGMRMDVIFRMMADALQMHYPIKDMDMDWINEYDMVKDKLFVCLSNAETNSDFLSDVPHLLRSDLALTCHILYEVPGEGFISTVVNDCLFEEYGIDKETLFRDAFESSMRLLPPDLGFVADILDDETEDDGSNPFRRMMLITNDKNLRGAAVLFYPGIMEEIAMKQGGSYYILPSSIHEVLTIPADPPVPVDDLVQMVIEANLLHVPSGDRLSDGVYFYDANSGKFLKAGPAVNHA